MQLIWPLLIVAIPPAAPIEAPSTAEAVRSDRIHAVSSGAERTRPDESGHYERAAAEEVFACSFDSAWDVDFDGWPDGWSRRHGPGFPRYVNVEISPEPTPSGDPCLRIDLDGGGAVAYSPAIPASNLYGYVIECQLSTEGLEHDRAFLSVTLLDEGRRRLQTFTSQKVCQTNGWTQLRLGPVATDAAEARLAVLGLHLEPDTRADLTGTARFGEVRLSRVPRLSLSIDPSRSGVSPDNVRQPRRLTYNLFTKPEGIVVVSRASGFGDAGPSVTFQLLDVESRTIAETRQPLVPPNSQSPIPPVVSAEWRPPVPGPGFYWIRAEMSGRDEKPLGCAEVSLTVIEPLREEREEGEDAEEAHPRSTEFGWTLPRGGHPLGLDDLVRLVEQSGVGRVKYPLWIDAAAAENDIKDAIRFSGQLRDRGIDLVGILADPPFEVPDRLDQSGPPSAAEIFSQPQDLWSPSLTTLMTHLATQVRRWQLGLDTDTSFVGYPRLPEKIVQVKAELDRLGSGVQVGFGWDWSEGMPVGQPSRQTESVGRDARPTGQSPPWQFVVLSSKTPLGPDQLGERLADRYPSQVERWVGLEPLDRSHPASRRAADLVQRIVAAKAHGVQGIFASDVFGAERGLLNDDGTPTELLLPWRTAALLLGGAKSMGTIQMPGGSSNQLFARGDHVVMVVWNDTPTEEPIYLGREIRQVDPWGRRVRVSVQQHRQLVATGPLPTFVTGIDGQAVRWRQGVQLATTRVPSVFGRPQANELRLVNPSDREAEGVLTLVAPDRWQIDPPQVRFKLAAAEELRQPLLFTLPYDATAGRQLIRVDFEIRNDKRGKGGEAERGREVSPNHSLPPYPPLRGSSSPSPNSLRFSAYRPLDVGLGDVTIEVATRLGANGELEVRQELVNHGQKPVSFRCLLFAPERRRLIAEILDQGQGSDVTTYRLPDGSQLLGKLLWIRAEDLLGAGNRRILNYRFVAQP